MDITMQDLSNNSRKKINEVSGNCKAGRQLVDTHLLQLNMELAAQVTHVKNIITFEQQSY